MKEYLTVEQAGEILMLGRNTMYKLVSRPDFPKIKIGKNIRIPKEDLEKFMEHNLYKEVKL